MTAAASSVKKLNIKSTKWPLIYSVAIQTNLMYLLTVYVSLLAPFSDSLQENDHLNFIHDALYEQLDRVQLTNAKFSSIALLGFIYGPIKLLITKLSTTIPPINVLLIMRLFISLISVSCWRFLQKRISFNFGSRVAFLFFLSEIFNWTFLFQASRFSENNLLRSLSNNNLLYLGFLFSFVVFLSLGLFIEKKFLFSLCFICLTLPILRENSLNLLSACLPLFLNREIFEKDPLAMFSFLSISGVVIAINPKNPYMITETNLTFLKNPFALMTAFTITSGLISKNFFILKLSAVQFIGNLLFEPKMQMEPNFFPYLSLAFALSFAQIMSKGKQSHQIHSQLESSSLKLFTIILALLFAKNCFKSVEISPGGKAALQLNDLLVSELNSCPGIVKAHVSKSVQSLGFSKFSSLKHSRTVYEFGTIYDEQEMLQKFKYRVADIDENVDPAYWRVKRVLTGMTSLNDKISKLQVKIMIRKQADD